MKVRLSILIGFIATVCSGFILIGSNPIQDVILSLQNFHLNNYHEKVYLQTDTDLYYSGEIVWISVRLLDAQEHTPSKLSKIVHVKLFDENNKELYHNKVLTKNGIGNSDISLSDTLSTGVYKIQAYTEWMKNFSKEYFFNREIYIVKDKLNNNSNSEQKHKKLDVGFFPEGGTMILHVENKVGFKIMNENGEGVDAKGDIIDENDNKIISISTFKFGIGQFELTPEENKSYYFQFEYRGRIEKFNLPDAQTEGIKLNASSNESDILPIEIKITKNHLKSLSKIFLISHCRGKINYAAEGAATSNSIIDIPKNKLVSGVNHITIFNQEGLPLAERLIFIQPQISSKVTANIQKTHFSKRSKVELTIDSDFAADINLSISVHDRPLNGKTDITNYLLLTSDLEGRIENPEYYFQDTDSARRAADNLMLTQGWVRFNWEDILDNNKMQEAHQYPAERIGPVFRGKLIDLITNKPVRDTLIILSTIDKNPNFLFNRLSDNSEFIFNLHEFYGNHKLFVNVYQQDSLNQFKLISADDYDEFKHSHLNSTTTNWNFGLQQHLEVKRKDDIIFSNYRLFEPSTSVNWKEYKKRRAFRLGQDIETSDYIIKPDEYLKLNDLPELLKELAPATTMRNIKGKRKLFVYEYVPLASAQRDIPKYNMQPATLYLDGIPMFNEEFVFDNLKYSDIDKVDIFIGQYKYAGHDFHGFVSVNTRDISAAKNILSYTTNSIDYTGLSISKEFYSPKYTVDNPYEIKLPDLRHLLYWKPDLIVKKNGTATVEFYTSDMQGDFFINIEGISNTGQTVKVVKRLNVSKDVSN